VENMANSLYIAIVYLLTKIFAFEEKQKKDIALNIKMDKQNDILYNR